MKVYGIYYSNSNLILFNFLETALTFKDIRKNLSRDGHDHIGPYCKIACKFHLFNKNKRQAIFKLLMFDFKIKIVLLKLFSVRLLPQAKA
jgi:hypothetical protein